MIKLAKYLKPFIFLIICSVLLLYVQAMADLALPDYMSRIVNVGIQQGGIKNALPEAVRESTMDKILIFMREEEQSEVLNAYDIYDKQSDEDLIKRYPALQNESIYILKDIDKETEEELNQVMGEAFIAVSGIENAKANAKDGFVNLNGQKVPEDIDLFNLLAQLNNEERYKIIDDMNSYFTALGEDMAVQGAVNAIRSEYREIGINLDKLQSNTIINTGLLMLGISLISVLTVIGVGFCAARISAGLSRNLREAVFEKVTSFSNSELDKFSTASLITRTTNDITQIQMVAVMLIRTVFFAPIMGIGGIIRALENSRSMSWIIVVAVVLLLSLITVVFMIAIPKFKKMQKLVDKLNLVSRENLSGMQVIRAFNREDFEDNRFDNVNREFTGTNLFVSRVMSIMPATMTLLMNGISLLIIWVGAKQIATSDMQVGDLMAFIQYVMQIIFAFLSMSFLFIVIPRASVAAQRIAEVLDTKTNIVNPTSSKDFDGNKKGEVEFKDVCFKYPGAQEDMLKNITFKAEPGKTTAIIGATGSGKSTLANLIPRLYDVTNGKVLVNGTDVRDVLLHELRNKIGYVPQKSVLLSGTIESNLKYAKQDATDPELYEAAEIAQAIEFIDEKPEKFESEISQGGTNVSGGQKQRLSIARALIKKPDIFIFDDSFSALDFKTDATLRKELSKRVQHSTVIIIAQRISTIVNADKILVLDKGRIVGSGTHKQLLENCQEYREIASSQLSKEEL